MGALGGVPMETHKRTLVKTITFRVAATLSALIIVYAYTGDWRMAGIVGAIDAVSKSIIYYFHERIWTRIHWGLTGHRR